MNEAVAILQLVVPYLSYLGAPLLLFCSLAFADQLADFAIDIIRRVKVGYRA